MGNVTAAERTLVDIAKKEFSWQQVDGQKVVIGKLKGSKR
jgi:hypothetical protein